MVAAIVFVGTLSLQMLMLVLLAIVVIATILNMRFQPYQLPEMNGLESASLHGSLVTFFVAALLADNDNVLGQRMKEFLSMIMVGMAPGAW